MPKNLYSTDIKLVVVWMVLQGMTFPKIVCSTGVDFSLTTVCRWFNLYWTTHAVVTNPLNHARQGVPCTLGAAEKAFVLQALELDPTLYLNKLQAKLQDQLRRTVSVKTLSTELQTRLCWTRKKGRTVHPNQSVGARGAYIEDISQINPRCLVFVDETAISKRTLYHTHARAPAGKRISCLQRPTQASRWSALPAISMDGIVAVSVQPGGYSRLDFESYFEHDLLPAMNLFPAWNSVLVMDNAPIHHGGQVAELCAARGVRLVYLPVYSPDFNPIKRGFLVLKSRLRHSQVLQRALNADDERAAIFIACMELFTEDLCEGFFRRSGYL